MKNKKYIVKGTPIVPSLCGICMAVLWYLVFYFAGGEWTFEMRTVSFEGMSGMDTYLMIMALVIPVLFFIGVLFLAELDVRWMLLPLLAPVVQQISLYVFYLKEDYSEYVFDSPVKFTVPFLALILFALTVEKVIPTKWVFVGFCGVAVLLPLILTLCGIGEFTFQEDGYDAQYNYVNIIYRFWSDYLSFALYYVGLAALTVRMRSPKESDFVSLKEMKQAYEEKMAAQDALKQASSVSAEQSAEEELQEAAEAPEETPEET